MDQQIIKSKTAHAALNNKKYWKGAFDGNHPDTARHHILLQTGLRLIEHIQPNSLLTIGDNLARDAAYFKKKIPNCNCTASDLEASGLLQAVEDGHVDSIMNIDVERIGFPDSSIDIVIAKEAFHHWPRPMLGLYEMLRVAKKAILLIEPNDVFRSNSIETYCGPDSYSDQYEEVGNYKYQISVREIIKSAWSLYLPMCATIGLNDPYKTPFCIEEWKKEKMVLDNLGATGKRQFNLFAIAIYKNFLDPTIFTDKPEVKYYLRPLNPYDKNDYL
jgi:SAM-dependent methyltransferase